MAGQDGMKMKFRYVEGWGKLPPGFRYIDCAGVAVDSKDNVHVFCRGEHPVIVFDPDGNFLRSWGEGQVKQAHAITIGPDDEVWLTDSGNHTICKYAQDGKLLLTIGDKDNPATLQSGKPFNRPTHVALCPRAGDIYISDGYGNSRVHKYDPKGRHLFSWGDGGIGPGNFNIPHNLVTDRHGLLYVADRENHRVQIFDSKGRYLDQYNNVHRPCGLFVDLRAEPVFYVGEFPTAYHGSKATPNLGSCVSIWSMRGEMLGRIGDRFSGEGPEQFLAPHALTVDSKGALYVAEVAYTVVGALETPPREVRCLQKYVPVPV
jgi:DNA-binding beta-propeller fold protein YncE